MTNHRFAGCLALVAASACGAASGAAKPKPLRYHFDQQHLASVPPEGKAELQAARGEYDRAVQENRKAESDWANSKRAIETAEREASRAHKRKEAADSASSAAEDSKDWNRSNRAKRDRRVAEVTARAADQKVDMEKARRSWLEKHVQYTRENVYAAEARFELAKAGVARAHNISPPDFAYQAYVDQNQLRQRKADKLKGPADSAREALTEEQKDYQAKRRDENEARGIDTAATSNKSANPDEDK